MVVAVQVNAAGDGHAIRTLTDRAQHTAIEAIRRFKGGQVGDAGRLGQGGRWRAAGQGEAKDGLQIWARDTGESHISCFLAQFIQLGNRRRAQKVGKNVRRFG
jgi:hypothetical protein